MFLLALVFAMTMATDAINCPDLPIIPNINSTVYSDTPHSNGSTVTISCVTTPFIFIPTPITPTSCIAGLWDTIPKCLGLVRACSSCNNGCEHKTLDVSMLFHSAWCAVSSQDYYLTGDLNGDGYCDSYCYTTAQKVYVLHYDNETRSNVIPVGAAANSQYNGYFCSSLATVVIEDANRDGNDDVICNQSGSLTKIIWGTPQGILSIEHYSTVPTCQLFTITNGEFVYDEVTRLGKASCNIGFKLRGLGESLCNQGGTWVGPVPPICEPEQSTSLLNIHHGKSLAEFDMQKYQLPSDSMTVGMHECLWKCTNDQKCSSARFDETTSTCDLFSINPSVMKVTFLSTTPNINLIIYKQKNIQFPLWEA